jgi:hypothetical protein
MKIISILVMLNFMFFSCTSEKKSLNNKNDKTTDNVEKEKPDTDEKKSIKTETKPVEKVEDILSCKNNSDCTQYISYFHKDGRCCHSCSYKPINKKSKALREKKCAAANHDGCPVKKCARPPEVSCENGKCVNVEEKKPVK